MRIIDSEGQQAVDALLYCADDPAERYSSQDTLRVQGSAYVELGTRLISNKGRVMARITADSCGRHDTSAGCCSCESNAVRFGEATKYQHACRENFILELSKHGLTKRDIVSNLNFFMNVPIDPSGKFTVVDGISAPGNYVEVTADMDVLFVISNCPQVNNPCNGFNPTPIRVVVQRCARTVTPCGFDRHDARGREMGRGHVAGAACRSFHRLCAGEAVDMLLVCDGERVFACERACPHEQADLSLGRVAEGRLLCPRHFASFDLNDGHISAGWPSRSLRRYPARIKDGRVWIDAAAIESAAG